MIVISKGFDVEVFCCFHRCSCVEPPDPSNATLRYWEQNNITASEIYWEALEVKVVYERLWHNLLIGSSKIRKMMHTVNRTHG